MKTSEVPLGFLALPERGLSPGVVMIHDVWGLSAHTRDYATRLANEGFVVLAIDLYRRGRPAVIADPGEWMRDLSDPQVLADLGEGARFLAALPETNGRVGVVGFCMGGMYALMAGCADLGFSASVPFYGLLSHAHGILHDSAGLDLAKKPRTPLAMASELRCPLLAFFGDQDTFIPQSDVRALERELARARGRRDRGRTWRRARVHERHAARCVPTRSRRGRVAADRGVPARPAARRLDGPREHEGERAVARGEARDAARHGDLAAARVDERGLEAARLGALRHRVELRPPRFVAVLRDERHPIDAQQRVARDPEQRAGRGIRVDDLARIRIERQEAVRHPVDRGGDRAPLGARSPFRAPDACRLAQSRHERLLERAQRGLDRLAVRGARGRGRVDPAVEQRGGAAIVHAQALECGLGGSPARQRGGRAAPEAPQQLRLGARGIGRRAAELCVHQRIDPRALLDQERREIPPVHGDNLTQDTHSASTRPLELPMRQGMETAAHRHVLISHAGPEAYAPMTRVILAKLGYLILLPEEIASIEDLADARPIVRLLDERQFAEIPDEGDGIPIVLVTGRHGATGADARIAGAVKRPVGMHELYRLIQQLTEETPRANPRVPTHLPMRCKSDGKEWTSTMLSLSENGCLVRSPEPLALGRQLELSFELPRSGRLQLEAETAYQLLPDTGLIFHATRQSDRAAIAAFVTNALLS